MKGTEVIHVSESVQDGNSLPGQIIRIDKLNQFINKNRNQYQQAMDDLLITQQNIAALMDSDVMMIMINWNLYRVERVNGGVRVTEVEYKNIVTHD